MVDCYLRGVNCHSGLQLSLFIASDFSPMLLLLSCWLWGNPSLLGAARVSLPTYSLKTAVMINCNNAGIASAPSLFVADNFNFTPGGNSLAIIEWKQTHSSDLAFPWDISWKQTHLLVRARNFIGYFPSHNPKVSYCSVFRLALDIELKK